MCDHSRAGASRELVAHGRRRLAAGHGASRRFGAGCVRRRSVPLQDPAGPSSDLLDGTIHAFGITAIATQGATSGGPVFFLASSLLAILFLDLVRGWLVLAVSIGVLFGFYGLFEAGHLKVVVDTPRYYSHFSTWLARAAVLAAVLAVIRTALGVFLRELRGALASAERERQRLFDLIEHAPDGIVLIEDRGTIHHVNRALAALFVYERQDLIGTSIDGLAGPPRSNVSDGATGPLALPPSWQAGASEVLGVHKDGSTFPIALSFGHLQEADGRLIVAIVRDLTEIATLTHKL
ncbi:MAG: PAS domain S-box protein [Alphaproteobacteria bacterium]|nr:PAS domain S-box protein [Alphaproteobacteria bacterium]